MHSMLCLRLVHCFNCLRQLLQFNKLFSERMSNGTRHFHTFFYVSILLFYYRLISHFLITHSTKRYKLAEKDVRPCAWLCVTVGCCQAPEIVIKKKTNYYWHISWKEMWRQDYASIKSYEHSKFRRKWQRWHVPRILAKTTHHTGRIHWALATNHMAAATRHT